MFPVGVVLPITGFGCGDLDIWPAGVPGREPGTTVRVEEPGE